MFSNWLLLYFFFALIWLNTNTVSFVCNTLGTHKINVFILYVFIPGIDSVSASTASLEASLTDPT